MAKPKPPEPFSLDQIEETYELIGELSGREDAQQFIAKRRADDAPVMISVFRTPRGDEGNAISHLASDTNRLAELRNRGLVPILEGRWVGTDAFAVVSERAGAPTLQELLSRREEEMSYARIAMILREVNGVIEWARAHKFVHRAVGLDTVFVEPGSDRVFVTFAVRPLPRTGLPGAEEDARNIARLARAMLTRSPAAPEREDRPLAELRPGLPARIISDTEKLLQPSRGRAEVPDIGAYISGLAMAEDLKSGEVHLEKVRDAIQEQQRLAREQLESERRAHQQQLLSERKAHEEMVAAQARRFAKERADFEQQLANERKALARERETLAGERAAHQRDCDALARERAAHARDSALLAEERKQHERLAEERRKQLVAATAALASRAKLSAEKAEAEQLVARMIETQKRAQRAEAAKLVAFKKQLAHTAPVPPKPEPPSPPKPPKPPKPSGPVWWSRSRWNRWTVPAAATGLLLLIGVFAVAGSNRRGGAALADGAPMATARATSSADVPPPAAPGAVTIDSVAGAVVTLPDTAITPWTPARPRPRVAMEPRPEPRPAPAPSTWSEPPSRAVTQARLPFAGRLDTMIVTVDTIVGGTTVEYRRGGTGAPVGFGRQRDTVRRDTLPRFDSIPRRDSTGARPNYF